MDSDGYYTWICGRNASKEEYERAANYVHDPAEDFQPPMDDRPLLDKKFPNPITLNSLYPEWITVLQVFFFILLGIELRKRW